MLLLPLLLLSFFLQPHIRPFYREARWSLFLCYLLLLFFFHKTIVQCKIFKISGFLHFLSACMRPFDLIWLISSLSMSKMSKVFLCVCPFDVDDDYYYFYLRFLHIGLLFLLLLLTFLHFDKHIFIFISITTFHCTLRGFGGQANEIHTICLLYMATLSYV